MRVKLPFAVSLNSILLVKGGNWVGLNTIKTSHVPSEAYDNICTDVKGVPDHYK